MPARVLVLFLIATSIAGGAAAQTPSTPPRAGQPVTLSKTVEPSFRIEPVVHRFSARRGEVLPFTFAIGSHGRAMKVTVRPVSLRQEETGVILPDGESPAAGGLRLTTPTRFAIGPGERLPISGELSVPLAKSNYLSYGLLVREEGERPDFENTSGETAAGIRFVTQYVLRIDVETGLADVGGMGSMRLERGRLVSEGGLPKVAAYLTNPTDFAYECYVSAKIPGLGKGRPQPIKLGMLSRRSLPGAERHLVRIMPRSSLRLEAPVEFPLAPGEQKLEISLSSGRRQVVAADFQVSVRDADFPALRRHRAVLGGVVVSPSQLELGLIKSTDRTLGLKFLNGEREPLRVDIQALSLSGEPVNGVRISPAAFTLKPGRSKGARAMLRGKAAGQPSCAVARVTVTRANGDVESNDLPISMLYQELVAPELDVSPVAWEQEGPGGRFVVVVENRSAEYSPVHATLEVGGSGGLRLQMQDGYGAWVAPGAKRRLEFAPPAALPAGSYQLALQIKTREEFPPVVRELNVMLEDAEASKQAAADTSPVSNAVDDQG